MASAPGVTSVSGAAASASAWRAPRASGRNHRPTDMSTARPAAEDWPLSPRAPRSTAEGRISSRRHFSNGCAASVVAAEGTDRQHLEIFCRTPPERRLQTRTRLRNTRFPNLGNTTPNLAGAKRVVATAPLNPSARRADRCGSHVATESNTRRSPRSRIAPPLRHTRTDRAAAPRKAMPA
jgi:hypothetical protein